MSAIEAGARRDGALTVASTSATGASIGVVVWSGRRLINGIAATRAGVLDSSVAALPRALAIAPSALGGGSLGAFLLDFFWWLGTAARSGVSWSRREGCPANRQEHPARCGSNVSNSNRNHGKIALGWPHRG
jgi:hypothetical protein